MKRILINFHDYQEKELKKLSYESDKSISDHVRKAVDLYFKIKKGDADHANTIIRPEDRRDGDH